MVEPTNSWRNTWGRETWGRYDDRSNRQTDKIGFNDPRANVENIFNQMGWAGDAVVNPWVGYVYNQVAPSLKYLWAAQGRQGTEGFTDWQKNILRSSTQTPGQAGDAWLSYNQFGNVLQQLLSGSAPAALSNLFVTSPDNQLKELQGILGLGGMAQNDLEEKAMQNDLRRRYMDYQNMTAAGANAGNQGLIDYLARSDWFKTWFPQIAYQYTGRAPGAVQPGMTAPYGSAVGSASGAMTQPY